MEAFPVTVRAKLFITCIGEQFFPQALKSTVTVLERVGVQCEFPEGQTCCGQPLLNSGFQSEARGIARHWLRVFGSGEEYIVAPSGSCVDMVRHHLPDLFPAGSPERAAAVAAAERIFEFTQFLVGVLQVTDVGAFFPHKVAYHASCHLLRGLGVRDEPRELLRAVRGLELLSLSQEEACCGFGGVFSLIYPEVSQTILEAKIRAIAASGADVITACDPGCLISIAGGLVKMRSRVRALHIAELLAADTSAR